MGDYSKHCIEHVGNVPLHNSHGSAKCLSNVLHVPTITKNLISVGQIVEKGLQVRFTQRGCFVENPRKGLKIVAKGERKGRLFTMDINNVDTHKMCFTHNNDNVAEIDLWHKRIGHVNFQKLKSMQANEIVYGLPKFKDKSLHYVCEACQFGKQARLPFKRDRYMSSYVLQLVHSDVWGPTRETSHGGNRYYVSFIDDYSRMTWVYVTKNKWDVFYYFKIFKSQVEKEVNAQIKILRSDGGGEYFSNEFSNFLIENGIRRQIKCRYTPQQNGVT